MSAIIRLRELTPAAFAPFGDVLAAPPEVGGRAFFSAGLTTGSGAGEGPSLHVNHVAAASPPIRAVRLERHPRTSQTFVPLDAARYVVLVAESNADGEPDPARMHGFVAPGDVGVTYRAGLWHHGMIALDRPGRFAVLWWRGDGDTHTEFAELADPPQLRP